MFSSFAVGKLRTRYGVSMVKLHCCIATFSNSACTVAVVVSKVTNLRVNFVEDECYQMATEFQDTSLRPDISVACT